MTLRGYMLRRIVVLKRLDSAEQHDFQLRLRTQRRRVYTNKMSHSVRVIILFDCREAM